jgi:hypothetical protein
LASVDPTKKGLPPVFDGWKNDTLDGICVTMSATLLMPRLSMNESSTTVVGVGVEKSSRRMRVPVMVISSSVAPGSRSCA